MLKHTPPGHPDYANLEEAAQQIGESVQKINEKKRAAEESQHLLQIQNDIDFKDVRARHKRRSIAARIMCLCLLRTASCQRRWQGFQLFAPSRSFVKEGPIEYLHKLKSSMQARFFLFNDLLVIVSRRRDKSQRYEVYATIELANAVIQAEEIGGTYQPTFPE